MRPNCEEMRPKNRAKPLSAAAGGAASNQFNSIQFNSYPRFMPAASTETVPEEPATVEDEPVASSSSSLKQRAAAAAVVLTLDLDAAATSKQENQRDPEIAAATEEGDVELVDTRYPASLLALAILHSSTDDAQWAQLSRVRQNIQDSRQSFFHSTETNTSSIKVHLKKWLHKWGWQIITLSLTVFEIMCLASLIFSSAFSVSKK